MLNDKYIKVILISAVGGLYMIAYGLYFIAEAINKQQFVIS